MGVDCTPAQTQATFAAFVQAYDAGATAKLDRLVTQRPYFVWFSVSGAGPRLGEASKDRSTLSRYFARRVSQRDHLTVVTWQGGGQGNFRFVLDRRALDELPSRYEGKGQVRCDGTATIAVWSMGRRHALPVVAPPARIPGGRSVRLGFAGCGGCVQTESWWATTRYRDGPNQLPPHETIAHLAADGLLVHVTRSWEPSPPAWMHRRNPLVIRRSAIVASFEGNTTGGRVSLWQATTWRGGSFVSVWVMFGRPVPTAAEVRRAQGLVAATTFAPWRIG
jgi:hypothetical protein